MSAYTSYGPSSQRLGGLHRAKFAVRDQNGRFMPVEIDKWNSWKLDPDHGVSGGKIAVIKAKRDTKGRFVK